MDSCNHFLGVITICLPFGFGWCGAVGWRRADDDTSDNTNNNQQGDIYRYLWPRFHAPKESYRNTGLGWNKHWHLVAQATRSIVEYSGIFPKWWQVDIDGPESWIWLHVCTQQSMHVCTNQAFSILCLYAHRSAAYGLNRPVVGPFRPFEAHGRTFESTSGACVAEESMWSAPQMVSFKSLKNGRSMWMNWTTYIWWSTTCCL